MKSKLYEVVVYLGTPEEHVMESFGRRQFTLKYAREYAAFCERTGYAPVTVRNCQR